MASNLRARLWKELLDEIRALLADLEDGGADLLKRAAVPSRWDGFPSSTLGAGGGSSDPNPFATRIARRVDHELGLPDDENGGPSRDPDKDPTGAAGLAMRANVLEARRLLALAVGAKQRGEPKLRAHRPAAAEAPECVNCARYEVYAPAYKDGRCVACYGYRRRHLHPYPLDAPEQLVRSRPENATRRSLATRVDPAYRPHADFRPSSEGPKAEHPHVPRSTT